MVKKSEKIKDALAMVYEITKMIKKSPKKESWLTRIIEIDKFNVDEGTSKTQQRINMFCTTRYFIAIFVIAFLRSYCNLFQLECKRYH